MGRYVNPGCAGFERVLRGRYVDKTGLVARVSAVLGTPDGLICVSRPRRFGKSFAAESLVAYYSCGCDSRALFEGLEVSRDLSFDEHLNAYNVVRLDMTDIVHQAGSASVEKRVSELVVSELQELLPELGKRATLSDALYEAARLTGRKFIFVVDEWDAIFRVDADDATAQRAYVDFLRSLFKNASFTSEVVAGAYLTGILPIKKYGTQSALNDFREYTMISPGTFAPYVGFTEGEVRSLCDATGMNFDEVKRWYDGYELPNVGPVYAPGSVMRACSERSVGSYWSSSETFESLRSYIDMDFDGLQGKIARMVAGADELVNTLGFQNDMTSVSGADDVLTLLTHLGYLAYDGTSQTVRVPNEEVRREFALALREGGHPRLARMVRESDDLLSATIAGDEEAVAQGVARAHDSAVEPDWYNDEQALRFAVKLAFLTSIDRFARIEELPSGHGRADIVYLPRQRSMVPAMIVELKWDREPETALAQVRERNYPAVLHDWGGPVLLVGITYDSKTKEHTCRIERMRKE